MRSDLGGVLPRDTVRTNFSRGNGAWWRLPPRRALTTSVTGEVVRNVLLHGNFVRQDRVEGGDRGECEASLGQAGRAVRGGSGVKISTFAKRVGLAQACLAVVCEVSASSGKHSGDDNSWGGEQH